jgi:hypothetical protein
MPIHMVPKNHHSTELQEVNNLSAGTYPVNDMVPIDERHTQLDGLHLLAIKMLQLRKEHPGVKIELFKSDVQSAFQNISMSPFFQFFQALHINGNYHINWCNLFGLGSASCVWTEFFCLVLWLAEQLLISLNLFVWILCWMDDTYGADIQHDPMWYEKYECYLPPVQHCLLTLWNELHIPHKQTKQESRFILTITGFVVDSIAFTFTLPIKSKESFVKTLCSFICNT